MAWNKDSALHELSLTTFLYEQEMANNNISLEFRINDDDSDDFTLHNIDPTTSVATTYKYVQKWRVWERSKIVS